MTYQFLEIRVEDCVGWLEYHHRTVARAELKKSDTLGWKRRQTGNGT